MYLSLQAGILSPCANRESHSVISTSATLREMNLILVFFLENNLSDDLFTVQSARQVNKYAIFAHCSWILNMRKRQRKCLSRISE